MNKSEAEQVRDTLQPLLPEFDVEAYAPWHHPDGWTGDDARLVVYSPHPRRKSKRQTVIRPMGEGFQCEVVGEGVFFTADSVDDIPTRVRDVLGVL